MTALRNAAPPDELARASETSEPEKGRWSQVEQLLALLIDIERQALHAFYIANSDKKHRKGIQPPDPLRRPGVAPPKEQGRTLSEDKAEALFQLIHGGTE